MRSAAPRNNKLRPSFIERKRTGTIGLTVCSRGDSFAAEKTGVRFSSHANRTTLTSPRAPFRQCDVGCGAGRQKALCLDLSICRATRVGPEPYFENMPQEGWDRSRLVIF